MNTVFIPYLNIGGMHRMQENHKQKDLLQQTKRKQT